MKKIAFIIANVSNCGGTEKICAILANNLCKKGFDITIISILGKAEAFFPLDGRIHVKTLYPFFKKNYINYLAKRKLSTYFNNNKYDIVITVDTVHCNLTTYALKNSSAIHITWDHFNYEFNMSNSKRRKALNYALKYSNYFIVLSKNDEELYKRNFPNYKDKIHQIYNGVQKPIEKNTSEKNSKIVISLGRNSEQKGFDLLLKAWKIIENKSPDWRLIIYGQGCTSKELLKIKRKLSLNNVEFHEPNKNIDTIYNKAELYICSSRYEGISLSLIEAMQRAIPIVAFDCSKCMNEVITNKLDGILVIPNNYEELAAKTLELMQNKNLQNKLSNNARMKSEKFSEDQFINNWLDILNKHL